MAFDPAATARAIAEAHRRRTPFANLEGELAPPTIEDAYAAQEALEPIWMPVFGPVVGRKIATTTKVMQDLMGIDHPCGGLIYERKVHANGATLRPSDFVHGVVECELAVRLGSDLPDKGTPYTADEVRSAVGTVMAAFELIEDRNAVYRDSDARTLIADNAWNGGVVLGEEVAVPGDFELNGLEARVMRSGKLHAAGKTDQPMAALAWVANLAISRGQPMSADMIVITGSVVATFEVESGDDVTFSIDRIGSVSLTVE